MPLVTSQLPLPLVLAESIRQLFDNSGATISERTAALTVANAMLIVSEAPYDETELREQRQSVAAPS